MYVCVRPSSFRPLSCVHDAPTSGEKILPRPVGRGRLCFCDGLLILYLRALLRVVVGARRCITALLENKSHIPYYESKLTLMLKDAIGGSSRTHVIVTTSLDEVRAWRSFVNQLRGWVCGCV